VGVRGLFGLRLGLFGPLNPPILGDFDRSIPLVFPVFKRSNLILQSPPELGDLGGQSRIFN
jgi:hypothetical protein